MKLITKQFIVDAELDKVSGGFVASCRPICITPPPRPLAPCVPIPHCDPAPRHCAPVSRGCGGGVPLG